MPSFMYTILFLDVIKIKIYHKNKYRVNSAEECYYDSCTRKRR
ncbi:hypothetical protein HMPREF0080_02097 [Anaeroglobus geminatus F0357]|uniref:Uncharacterized protein n=1 Tax=Anaeroglobus geminatus F0357 TaxID=861450 RepID=G9YK87_9FIRM|nr:hypothetical protein HMPREF0080_02097 [Anaeroglobus geminatus F0357]